MALLVNASYHHGLLLSYTGRAEKDRDRQKKMSCHRLYDHTFSIDLFFG